MPYYFKTRNLDQFYTNKEGNKPLRIAHLTSVEAALSIFERGFQSGFGSMGQEKGANFFSEEMSLEPGMVKSPECILCFEWMGPAPISISDNYGPGLFDNAIYRLENWRYVIRKLNTSHLIYVGGLVFKEFLHEIPYDWKDRIAFQSRSEAAKRLFKGKAGMSVNIDYSDEVTQRNHVLKPRK